MAEGAFEICQCASYRDLVVKEGSRVLENGGAGPGPGGASSRGPHKSKSGLMAVDLAWQTVETL